VHLVGFYYKTEHFTIR